MVNTRKLAAISLEFIILEWRKQMFHAHGVMKYDDSEAGANFIFFLCSPIGTFAG